MNRNETMTGPDTRRSTRTADRIVLILVVLCLAGFSIHNVVAHDLWWQLKTGQYIRMNGWPTTDPFSFGFPDRPWIEMRWVYCSVISLIFDGLGLNFLIVAKFLWLILTGVCLAAIGRGSSRWAVNLGLLCAVVLMHQRFTIRPELVSYGLLALVLLLLRRYQVEKKLHWLYPLPLIQILWVNSHTLFALGTVVVWIFTLAEIAAGFLPVKAIRDSPARLSVREIRPLAVVAVGVTLACLVNPYGLRGALFAVEVFTEIQSSHVVKGAVTELRGSLDAAGFNLLFIGYILLALVSALGFLFSRQKFSPGWLAVWAAFLYLSFLAERNIALFGMVAGASIIVNYGDKTFSPAAISAARAACILFMACMIPALVTNYYYRAADPDRRFGFGVAERRFPFRAMAFVAAESLPRPVLSNLGDGNYIMFEGGPKSVYIDGRLEIYGGENLEAALNILSDTRDLTAAADRYNIFTFIARHDLDTVLVGRLLSDPSWAAVYYDDSYIVFLRKSPATEHLIARFRIDWKNPESSQAQIPAVVAAPNWLSGVFPVVGESGSSRALGQLFLSAGNSKKAQEMLEKAVTEWPDDPSSRFQLGVLYRAQRREADAARLLAGVPPATLQTRDAQVFAAATYEGFDNNAAAAEAWLQVVNLGDRSPEVYQHLAKTAVAAKNWNAAYIALDELARRSTPDVSALNNLGIVADRANRKQAAVEALSRSLRLDPNQPQVLTQLGVLKLESGDAAAARKAFEQALVIDPNFDPARRQLESMKAP